MNPQQSKIELALNKLPEWAQEAVREVQSASSEILPQPVSSLVNEPVWPTLVKAAVVSSFLPRELTEAAIPELTETTAPEQPQTGVATASPASEVLTFSETLRVPGGLRWSLKQDVRQSVLSLASREMIQTAIEATAKRFADPVSHALRDLLSGKKVDLEKNTLETLEASQQAATLLRGAEVEKLKLPNLQELSSQVSMRRILKPFRWTVGIKNENTPFGEADIPFFGRGDEISELHDYVGVTQTHGFFQGLKRLASKVRQAVAGATTLNVWGIGGVGKTTLVSMFTLAHAEAANSRFPFAYLDFDRATLSARQPGLLLAEICTQVAAQFPEIANELETIKSDARKISVQEITTEELLQLRRVGPLLDRLRKLIDAHISSLEALISFKRPFLLVLDTFEIVQYSRADVTYLERFVGRLAQWDRKKFGWSRLRLVVSGRKQVTNFVGPCEIIELGPLDREGSAQMLHGLTNEAKKAASLKDEKRTSISEKDAERLINALAEELGNKEEVGFRPLFLRIVAESLSKESKSSRSVVDEIIEEVRGVPNQESEFRKALIEGILVRRILDHVADARVRALADPGLVVRRITPAVIRRVMALGTPNPDSAKEILDGDSTNFEPWILLDKITRINAETNKEEEVPEEDDIFDAFRKEVSLVDFENGELRHRQDLREEMLPLIQARRPNRFRMLHKLAFEFFNEQAAKDPKDFASRAEAIYHGLWHGVPLEQIDALWIDDPNLNPRLTLVEFRHSAEAQAYIRAKDGENLSDDQLKILPQSVRIKWIIAKAPTLIEEDDVNEAERKIRLVCGDEFEELDAYPSTAAIVARLLYRTGKWADSHRLIDRRLYRKAGAKSKESLRNTNGISMLRTWITMSARSGAERLPFELAIDSTMPRSERWNVHPVIQVEMLSFAVLGQRMLKEEDKKKPWPLEKIQRAIRTNARSVPSNIWPHNAGRLRNAIMALSGDCSDLLSLYFRSDRSWSRDQLNTLVETLAIFYTRLGNKEKAETIRRDGENLAGSYENVEGVVIVGHLRSEWDQNREQIIKLAAKDGALQSKLKEILVFDHQDWSQPIGSALDNAFTEYPNGELIEVIRGSRVLADLPGQSHSNGVEIVQWASSSGGLLELASTISSFQKDPPSKQARSESGLNYPNDVFALAKLLLRWHEVNLRFVREDSLPAPKDRNGKTPAAKPAKKKRRPL